MIIKKNIFSKINAVIFIFLIPILLLYGLSNQVSVQVVEGLLQKEKSNQLEFFRKQLDSIALSLAMNAITLTRDTTVLGMERIMLAGEQQPFNQIESTVQEKLTLQSSANSWYNDITLYFPSVHKTLSTTLRQVPYDEQKLDENVRNSGWSYRSDPFRPDMSSFIYYAGGPINENGTLDQSVVIVEVAFYEQNMTSLLDQLKAGSKGDPFMVDRQNHISYNRTSDKQTTNTVVDHLFKNLLEDKGDFVTEVGKKTYLVNYVYSQALGYYIVDYTPLEQILSPITKIRNFFYGFIMLLLAVGILASFLLYKHVQAPLHALTGVLKKFQNGDFSVRLNQWFYNEFDFVVVRFNDMAGQIQHLIENVYEEKNRSRLATLRQLQAQINPHFLYNCLNFIISSASLGRKESVIAMAYNLSDYYRYITRLDDPDTCLRDELKLVKNYLEIHLLRLQRIQYEINVPEEMMDIRMPRLLIQPIVENAIVHGLEPKLGGGTIVISGERVGENVFLTIEDNGVGLSVDRLQQLTEQLDQPMDETIGYGLWNVHQRLKYWYGEGSGLDVRAASSLTGLTVTIYWREGYQHDSIASG
ncbi:histidine kinase [Paenibacillus sp. WQ 127069]|uniref:Histidine kinase n=1 Tax=Paenibacillus baimaensis TaxID=2982185 RepID=A0ABT2UIT3_9BACL|nr:histidine kinase [Paenibacillus sp. WQ 127069]MCU6794549.1 histidine kinase [Paenibacillus sp. WQ 127069]